MWIFSAQPGSLLSSTKLNLNLIHVLVLLSISRPSVAVFQNDFSDYPAGTQTCLSNASDGSDCTGDTSAEMNQCLCSNGGNFVTNSARCIAQDDPSDMASTWEIMYLHCSDSNTPLSVSQAQFMAYTSSVSSSSSASSTASSTSTSTATQQTVTTTASSSPNTDDDDSNTGLSTAAKIGIIVGAAVAGVALLAAALFIFLRHRKQRQRQHQYEEVHRPPPGGPQPVDASTHPSHMSMGPSELESAVSTMGSPNIRNTWMSSDSSAAPWSPSAFESVKAAHIQSPHQPLPPGDVYEMPADNTVPVSPSSNVVSPSSNVAEMPAIEVTSPTISPTSRYSGVDWVSETSEPRRYEPFRPR